MSGASVLCILLLMAAALSGLCLQTVEASTYCNRALCPKPLCANPVTPKGKCCPSCENSNCKFKGCVNFLQGGVIQWAPTTPCIFCQCDIKNNRQFCAIIDCIHLTKEDCFGYPVVTRPNECCPSCDFGTRRNACNLVPQVFGQHNITVGASNTVKNCTVKVQKKGCDKFGFRSRGRTFRCDPKEGKRVVKFDDNCPLCAGTYKDTVRCRAVRDESIAIGCDFVV